MGRNILESTGEWFFFSGGPGAPRYGDDPTKHAVDHDTESFVREVIQNANDQRLNNRRPVEVGFDFYSLEGSDRDSFLRSLGWERELREHLQAVAGEDSGRGYNRFLERLSDPSEELRLLVVSDRNTTGLTGSWGEDSNYAALVRDELYSSKQDETAGGSYGLGKSVLWTFSGASTVLFNSLPSGDSGQRFVGRTKLPTHELGGTTYQGAGWLCDPRETREGTRPQSIRGEQASGITERLYLDRETDDPGTSMLVVGFRDPTRDQRPELDELADQFLEAAVKYFWPAIHRDDLRVSVGTPNGRKDADVSEVPAIRPFVECFEERYGENEQLDQPGDVAGLDVPIELPPRADGTETPDGNVRLAARLASPADDDTHLNDVALFRGAGMVVKYFDQSRVAFGDRNFHAVLACGEARTDEPATDGDLEIDRFLRYAEPPEHDDWISTENLREHYQRGFRTALDEMFGTMRDGLRHLIARTDGSADTLSQRVRKQFPIHGNIERSSSVEVSDPVFDIWSDSAFENGRWVFDGELEVLEDEFRGWSAEISLRGVNEDGGTFERVPIETVRSEQEVSTQYTDGTAEIVAEDGVGRVKFEGESVQIDDAGGATTIGETQLEIRAELTEGE
jgi:hypothetical protein